MERTFVMIKPTQRDVRLGWILSKIELQLPDCRMTCIRSKQLSAKDVEFMYSHVKDREFYKSMEALYTGANSILTIWTGPNVVNRMRQFVGPTRPLVPGTLRHLIANHDVSYDNVIHASDNYESAQRELDYFF